MPRQRRPKARPTDAQLMAAMRRAIAYAESMGRAFADDRKHPSSATWHEYWMPKYADDPYYETGIFDMVEDAIERAFIARGGVVPPDEGYVGEED